MGTYINLVANLNGIDDKEWEKTYKESVKMLQKFPLPLIRFKEETIRGSRRLVAIEKIVEDKGLVSEHWEIFGDGESEQHFESFTLYRYQKAIYDIRSAPMAKNILWAPKDSIDYLRAWGAEVFGNKTQGAPYHLAVLAAGILFEDRFPDSIFVAGDINREQAEVVLPWMNSVLKKPVKLPIVTDGERLYTKLQELYDDPDLVIQRFKTLHTEPVIEEDILFKHAPRAYVSQNFVERLGEYTAITDGAAIRLIIRFLAATQDIKQLIELVLQVGKGRTGFELAELLRILVARFITVAKETKKPLSLLAYRENPLETIGAISFQTRERLVKVPEMIDFNIDSAELLKTFVSYMPSKEDVLQAIIQEEEQKCYQTAEKIQKIRMDVEEELSPKQQGNEEQGEEVPSDLLGPLSISPESYIGTEAHMQKDDENKEIEELAKRNMPGLLYDTKKAVNNLPKVARDKSLQFYKSALYKGSYDNDIILLRAQWDCIDNCEDKAILKSLMVLAKNTSNLLVFVRLRKYILKNPQIWPQLIV